MDPVQISIDVDSKAGFPDASDWHLVFTETLHILSGLAQVSGPHRTAPTWKISEASFQSPLHLTLLADADAEDGHEAIQAYIQGLKYLDAEKPPADPPPFFDDSSLRAARHIVSVLKRNVASIVFSSPELGSVSVTQRIALNVNELIGVKFTAMGAIEGILDTLNAKGKLNFNIYDPLKKYRTSCYIPLERLEEAKHAFLHRVAVYGEINYAKNGRPLSIEVLAPIRRLRSRGELPQARDLEGIDITGGIDPSEYIRGLRDAD